MIRERPLTARRFAPVGWVLGGALLVCSAGCVPLVLGAAGGAAGAVYVMGKLTEEVDHEVPVVHEATLAAVKDLDLTPTENRADRLTAHVESEFADRAHVWIDLESAAASRTKITVRVGLTGDEARSRKILDLIKRHLPRSVAGRLTT